MLHRRLAAEATSLPRRTKSTDEKSPPDSSGRLGLPALTVESPRITVLLRGDELDALTAFARAHRWPLSTAIRALLRERLLDEELPF